MKRVIIVKRSKRQTMIDITEEWLGQRDHEIKLYRGGTGAKDLLGTRACSLLPNWTHCFPTSAAESQDGSRGE